MLPFADEIDANNTLVDYRSEEDENDRESLEDDDMCLKNPE